MALLKATILFILLGKTFNLLVPDSDGDVTSIKGDDNVRSFNLKSPIPFSGGRGSEESIQTLFVRKIFHNS